jgi:formylglycine-generating enzyme
MGRNIASTASDYYSGGNPDEIPEHGATVASFALDKYEVTVGRFRKFVNAYDAWHVDSSPPNPTDNAGAHPIAANTGWGKSWTASSSDLPAGSSDLRTLMNCHPTHQTWTDDGSGNENYPVNCASWYMAFAFCIWDGGRLPTEAEWEYAAAGGSQNYLYPWGIAAPDHTRANYYDTDRSPFIAVGSKGATGASYYGHADLAGSMWEWIFDYYSSSYYGTSASPTVCDNCANTSATSNRGIRGDCWYGTEYALRGASRDYFTPADPNHVIGFRCARTP